MRNSLMIGTALALMASTALAGVPAGMTFGLDAAKVAERTGAPAGLILAADDDEDEGGLLFRLGLRGDGGLLAGQSDDDEDDEDEDEDEDENDDEGDEGDDGDDGDNDDGDDGDDGDDD